MEVRGSVVSIDPMFESAPQISLLLYFDRLERFSRIDPRVSVELRKATHRFVFLRIPSTKLIEYAIPRQPIFSKIIHFQEISPDDFSCS
jgi:hypothetical protein